VPNTVAEQLCCPVTKATI